MWMWIWTVQLMGLAVVGGNGAAEGDAVKQAAPAQPAPTAFADADALLLALEKADAGLVSFEARIEYDRRFELQGDRHVRRGDIYYKAEVKPGGERPEAPAVFAVSFNQLQIEEAIREEQQMYVFDGEWFIEKNFAARRFIKRQVALPGERINPLRLGEGPFPIPIGQKRDDILTRYEAKLVGTNESIEEEPELQETVKGSTQIVLTPRAAFDRDEFREIRLWYRPDDRNNGRLLPRMARTLNRQGDVSIVRLIGMKVNDPTFPAAIADVAEPPADEDWDVQRELKRVDANAQGGE